VTIVKALASAITIGTGGSVGREGPIVQIGSALASTLGLLLLALPQMYGVGYPVMDSVIAGHVVFGLVLVLLVGKVAATSPHPVDRRIGRRVRPLSVHRDDDGHGLRHRRDRATGALLRRGIDIERPRRNETLARATGR
jgi:hypothetical protein